jgi:hypothetical protein
MGYITRPLPPKISKVEIDSRHVNVLNPDTLTRILYLFSFLSLLLFFFYIYLLSVFVYVRGTHLPQLVSEVRG